MCIYIYIYTCIHTYIYIYICICSLAARRHIAWSAPARACLWFQNHWVTKAIEKTKKQDFRTNDREPEPLILKSVCFVFSMALDYITYSILCYISLYSYTTYSILYYISYILVYYTILVYTYYTIYNIIYNISIIYNLV